MWYGPLCHKVSWIQCEGRGVESQILSLMWYNHPDHVAWCSACWGLHLARDHSQQHWGSNCWAKNVSTKHLSG